MTTQTPDHEALRSNPLHECGADCPLPPTFTAAEIHAAADRAIDRSAAASIEGRRLVLMVELEQLTLRDLTELSDFLNGLLGSRCLSADPADPPVVDGAVSVRAAYAFGDWPPVLEAVSS